jgi:hypothetical protein
MKQSNRLPASRKRWLFLLLGLVLILLLGIGWNANKHLISSDIPASSSTTTTDIITISLAGEISDAEAEISGMTWYEDWLILLPQYPARFGNHVFALARHEIIDFLDGTGQDALSPHLIPIDAGYLEDEIPGFQGFEAIGCKDNDIYLTIEASHSEKMSGYLIQGEIEPGNPPSRIILETSNLHAIEPQAALSNFSDESLVIYQELIYTLYEANGVNVNSQPIAHVFQLDLTPQESIPFPSIEYRITDATSADAEGSFWAINYLFPGDLGKLRPAPDEPGNPPGDSPTGPVERLVAFRIEEGLIKIDTTHPPINLTLLQEGEARNWEAIARLNNRGFLIATDRFPGTILGFVPYAFP